MPPKHQVPTLVELALCSVSDYVIAFGESLVGPVCELSLTDFDASCQRLRNELSAFKSKLSTSIPWLLFEPMAHKALKSLSDLIDARTGDRKASKSFCKYILEVNILIDVTEVLVNHNIRTLDMSGYTKGMRNVLYDNLHHMTSLEILDLGSGSDGWRSSEIERYVIRGVSSLPNLVSLALCTDCTDNIIATVGQTCRKLRILDITASRSVTFRSIPSLLKCQNLRQLIIFRTSLGEHSCAELLLGLPHLEVIGQCIKFRHFLEEVELKEPNVKLALRVIDTSTLNTSDMLRITKMCPYITRISMKYDDQMGELYVLSALEHLRELKFTECHFYTDAIDWLLQQMSSRLKSLTLSNVYEIDWLALFNIAKYCTHLEELKMYHCDILGIDNRPHHGRQSLEPFKYLETLQFFAECVKRHLEFLLSPCKNIRYIELGSSTGIDDATMERILNANKMPKLEELKIFSSSELSMKTVRLLMQNCKSLRRLSELEGWGLIKKGELSALREELKRNNLDLDTSPTLSLPSSY
uniref:Uncharacterized protein n=1 Tax=Bracon brevicornis TaxID=1563983 RepID=A0A6V7JEG8_9HYME